MMFHMRSQYLTQVPPLAMIHMFKGWHCHSSARKCLERPSQNCLDQPWFCHCAHSWSWWVRMERMSPRTHDVLLKCNWVKVEKCCQSLPTFPCSAWIRCCCQAVAVWTFVQLHTSMTRMRIKFPVMAALLDRILLVWSSLSCPHSSDVPESTRRR